MGAFIGIMAFLVTVTVAVIVVRGQSAGRRGAKLSPASRERSSGGPDNGPNDLADTDDGEADD